MYKVNITAVNLQKNNQFIYFIHIKFKGDFIIMKKIKSLCLIAALGVMLTGGSLAQSTPAYAANTIHVSEGGTSLEKALASAKSGDTILIDGAVHSTPVKVPAGVNIIGGGEGNFGQIDFSGSSGSNAKGLTINGNGSTIANLEILNAGDNGIYMEGSNNTLQSLWVHNNHDAGVQLSNGAANNKLNSVISYYNADATGENADGFAIKLHSGEGNVLTDCTAQENSDDGYDLYAAHGAVTFIRCKAIANGSYNGISGDGNGFKVGGVDNKTPGEAPKLVPENHVLIDCVAQSNLAVGFDRNNQSGIVTMKNCTGQDNVKGNFGFPATGTPSALKQKVTFGRAIIDSCTSIGGGENDISGADLKGNCTGF